MNRSIAISVSGWLDTLPDASRILEVLGFHLCGDPAISLETAARRAGIDPDEALALLEKRDTSRELRPLDWMKVPLSAITREIVEVYHRRTRHRLVTLLLLSARVRAAHASTHRETSEIHDELERMARDLIPHMISEEKYLFPYIASMESAKGVDSSVIVPLMGTVQHPMKSLQHQHSTDRGAFQKIRLATSDFTAPAGSCEGIGRLYAGLKELDQDLINHLTAEDAILFPRAVEVEKEISRR
jgi:regulator of cell morphogenesis and NO signaling